MGCFRTDSSGTAYPRPYKNPPLFLSLFLSFPSSLSRSDISVFIQYRTLATQPLQSVAAGNGSKLVLQRSSLDYFSHGNPAFAGFVFLKYFLIHKHTGIYE